MQKDIICLLAYIITKLSMKLFGAGDEIRTHDIYLGKVTLYPWATPATDFLYMENCEKQIK